MAEAVIGAREWVTLPDLDVAAVLAKVDTGARTSTLHAHTFVQVGHELLFEAVLADRTVECRAPLVDWRWVRDSGGHPTFRPVVRTRLSLGPWTWEDEVTLFDRSGLRQRMLLGRRAVAGRFLVDARAACIWGDGPERVASGQEALAEDSGVSV